MLNDVTVFNIREYLSAKGDKDIFYTGHQIVTVNHVTKSPKFILLVNRLVQSIRISMFPENMKSIQVHAVENLCRMPLRYKVFGKRKRSPAVRS